MVDILSDSSSDSWSDSSSFSNFSRTISMTTSTASSIENWAIASSIEIDVENSSLEMGMSPDCDHAVAFVKNLFNDEESRDVTLVAGNDRQKFPVHRLVMMNSSAYFVALFGVNFKEGEQDEVTINDIDGVTLKAVIDFCYLGKIEITDANIAEIIGAASYMQLLRLQQKCERFCVENLTTSNCVGMASYAHIYCLKNLRAECLKTLQLHFECVTDFEELDHSIFCTVLKHNHHFIHEDILFERLVKWIDYDVDKRSKFAATLFESIQLHKITLPILLNAIETYALKHNCHSAVMNECRRRLELDDRSTMNTLRIDVPRPHTICVSSYNNNVLSIHQYNPITDRWSLFAQENAEDQMKRRQIATVAASNRLLFIGGTKTMETEVNLYDMDRQELSDSSRILKVGGQHMTPVYFRGRIFVFGGIKNRNVMNRCESFSLNRMESRIRAPMMQRRYKYAAAVMNDRIYVAGGEFDPNTQLDSVECYDPVRNKWVQLANMNHPRSLFALVECDGTLYAMGHHESVERYDSLGNNWTDIGSFEGSHKISRAISLGGQIYVLTTNGRFGVLKVAPQFSWCPLRKLEAPSECRRLLFIRRSDE